MDRVAELKDLQTRIDQLNGNGRRMWATAFSYEKVLDWDTGKGRTVRDRLETEAVAQCEDLFPADANPAIQISPGYANYLVTVRW